MSSVIVLSVFTCIVALQLHRFNRYVTCPQKCSTTDELESNLLAMSEPLYTNYRYEKQGSSTDAKVCLASLHQRIRCVHSLSVAGTQNNTMPAGQLPKDSTGICSPGPRPSVFSLQMHWQPGLSFRRTSAFKSQAEFSKKHMMNYQPNCGSMLSNFTQFQGSMYRLDMMKNP